VVAHPVRQALTERIVFTPMATATLRIVLTPFDGRPTRVVALQAMSEVIPIEISSLPAVAPLAHAVRDPEARHFETFYDLLDKPVEQRLVPIAPLPLPTATAAFGDIIIWCPGSRMRLPG
jgi:hypothetical protein